MKTLITLPLKTGASIAVRDIPAFGRQGLTERQLVINAGEEALVCEEVYFDPTDVEASRWTLHHMKQSLRRAVSAINA